MKAACAQVVEEGVPPRWVDETLRESDERRAQHDRAGRAEAARSDAAVVRRRADSETALVVAKAAKMTADKKVAGEHRRTASGEIDP